MHLAAQTDRTPDQIAQQAVDGYLQHIEILTAEAREGEESADKDGWLTHEEVFARINQRLHKTS
ncbi:hypothetical protein BH10ACI4_BH10ACI4_22900 [soil metagenome]